MRKFLRNLLQHWGGRTSKTETQVQRDEEMRLMHEVRLRLGSVKQQLSEVDERLEEHQQLSERKGSAP